MPSAASPPIHPIGFDEDFCGPSSLTLLQHQLDAIGHVHILALASLKHLSWRTGWETVLF